MLDASVSKPRLADAKRRRSLSVLFRIPLATRSVNYHSVAASKPVVGSIPADVIREIVDLLSPADILNFSLTCWSLRYFVLPSLYDTVTLKSSRKCRVTLEMLANRPDICAHIRKFAVRPNYYLAWPKPDEHLEEDWVAHMIQKIAPSLVAMHTFDWDGLEMPLDQLWGTLRTACPNLRNVSSNIGSRELDPYSELFNFSDLKSFSLIVRYGLDGNSLFPISEELPPRCWTMLAERCPNLEELVICSFSSSTRNLNFLPVTTGKWPKLTSLTLGSFGYRSDFSLGPAADPAFMTFLDDHPSLEYIRLQWNFKRWMSPNDIPMTLAPKSLPRLDTFIGIYQQLVGLPHPESIETLDLTCEPLHESRVDTVCPILRTLTSLSSLDIWAHVLGPSGDHKNFFREILESCPGLTDLHFMCTTTFTGKPLKQLLSLLPLLPSLKRFSLTKGHKYGDESMLSSALQILHHHPSLQQINIRWARERSPNHLKQEGTYDVTVSHGSKSGGEKVVMMVQERGIPLLGRPFSRRYKYTVRRRWRVR